MNAAISADRLKELLLPYLQRGAADFPAEIFEQLARYLKLLVKWNSRTNLTSVRDPEQMVLRHFGESLFAGQHLGECETVLDFGSGAGFPGLPIQLLRPRLRVTLAESQNKKAAFLREAVRTLELDSEIWASRVEFMPQERRFDVVAMRAVDNMETALAAAALKAKLRLIVLTTDRHGWKLPEEFDVEAMVAVVGSDSQHILVLKRV